ncbi:MAG: c-type cytochrome [Rudaea sp.]
MDTSDVRARATSPAAWVRLAPLAAFAVALAIAPMAGAQRGDRSGKEVVDSVCIACHGTGVDGAPKIGDVNAWSARAARGLTGLTQNALAGIRKMPAHGGNPGLSDTEIERAITYMVNQSGGQWAEPINPMAVPVERSGEQVVAADCVKCHGAGVGGAPRIGDRTAWIPRLKRGLHYLTLSAINGHGGMPPRGGMANLTDKEIEAAIAYMLNPASVVARVPAPPQMPVGPHHHVVEGTDIYFGIVSANSLHRDQKPAGVESKMHGGIPSGSDYYHVAISLFDSTTHAPIVDAQVDARVSSAMGGGTQRKPLELMVLNQTVSYGNYFRMPGKQPYTIDVLIRAAGAARPIETRFDFQR